MRKRYEEQACRQRIGCRRSLQHQLGEHHQLHATASRGYKSGGINLDALSPRIAPQFAAEIAEGAELGWRGILWGGSTAASVYYRRDPGHYARLADDRGAAVSWNRAF